MKKFSPHLQLTVILGKNITHIQVPQQKWILTNIHFVQLQQQYMLLIITEFGAFTLKKF